VAPLRVLVVNPGSSSTKVDLLDGDVTAGSVALDAGADIGEAIAGLGDFEAVGLRVVHGGTRFTEPVVVDDAVEAALRDLTDLAPLHQPKSLAALEAVRPLAAGKPIVACFDTAFHASLPDAAATYAIPSAWRERWGVRRYGFHGLSHAYASRRAAELAGGDPQRLRVVTCHLGAGASLAAVVGGRSVDTTMGFTPLEGLVMATRSGTVDPGLVLWLQTHGGLSADEVTEALDRQSGLLALSGSDDMRQASPFALHVYLHRLRASIAAMAGIDALVFTGGVGEHSVVVRKGAAETLGFLGLTLDPSANDGAEPDCEITGDGPVRVFVIRAREDLEIARGVSRALRS
jgi:acetate kinase